MNSELILWIAVPCFAAHVLEEYAFDWNGWIFELTGLEVGWPSFFLTNAAAVVLGLSCASVGWRLPSFSLIFPGMLFFNAVGFHLLPAVVKRRYSPGLVTALLLFIPVATWAFKAAWQDGVLDNRTLFVSLIGGLFVMAFPVIVQRLKGRYRS
jgi:hypothetical protein